MIFRILQLSDLHCNSEDETYLRDVGAGLRSDLELQLNKLGGIDCVCLTGDTVNKGALFGEEIDLADEIFLSPIAELTGIPKNDFFTIPGNHEMDRDSTSQAFELGLQGQLTKPEELRRFQKQILAGKGADKDLLHKKLGSYFAKEFPRHNTYNKSSCFFFDIYEQQWNGIKVGIVGLNSAWRCSGFGSDDKRLLIGEEVVTKASQAIQHCDLKICLCHHPLEMLTEWDCRSVTALLIKNFDLLLNGHVHDPTARKSQTNLGALFVSTCGSLRPKDPFSGYSILDIDFDNDRIRCQMQKWYGEERHAFGPDEAKAPGGSTEFPGVRAMRGNAGYVNKLVTFRGALKSTKGDIQVICPLDGIIDVELTEVFVDPILYDAPLDEGDPATRKLLSLNQLIQDSHNLVFYGRSEYGKSTLLRYAKEKLLLNTGAHSSCLPILIRFGEITSKTTDTLLRLLAKQVEGASSVDVRRAAEDGNLVLLIDDYDDREDVARTSKQKLVREFHQSFPKARIILTTTEHPAPQNRLHLYSIASDFEATPCYISCLNTSKMRDLVTKWVERSSREFEKEAILKQILYYFQHLQIPATPLATTLFLTVLFRRKKEHNIKNEAYLIENYFETLLEKLSPDPNRDVTEYHAQQDFLAHIALRMVQRNEFEWTTHSFETEKLAFYDATDDQLPNPSFFQPLFKKGVLTQDQGIVRFSRRTWFQFFLAKALVADEAEQQHLLERNDVVKFAKALGYKAGLRRNDRDLLKWVNTKIEGLIGELKTKHSGLELSTVKGITPLRVIGERIAQDIRAKNTDETVDKQRDDIYLKYEEDTGHASSEEEAMLPELVMLESDIIRNTTKLTKEERRRYLTHNVESYIALMWETLEVVKESISATSAEDLVKIFLRGNNNASMRQKLDKVLEFTEKLVHHAVPLSIILLMTDHLGTPRMANSYEHLANSDPGTKGLFFNLLLFSQDPVAGMSLIEKSITGSSPVQHDFIIFTFLRAYCFENRIPEKILDRIVKQMQLIWSKQSPKGPKSAEDQISLPRPDSMSQFKKSVTDAQRRLSK